LPRSRLHGKLVARFASSRSVAPVFSVLVNSSDGFEDCWAPFFKLFTLQWPHFTEPVLLNTETKDWSYPGVAVTCTKVQPPGSRKLTWSECLIAALDQVKTSLVLYLQEDYFLSAPVDVPVVEALARQMADDPRIRHIGLTHFGALGPFEPADRPELWKISQESRYRISTQAGLWRTDTLRSYLRPKENGWMFEIFGTLRARRRRELFLTVNREMFGPGRRVIDYLHTGIIKGRWHPQVPAIFEKSNIHLDYDKRGFYKEPSPAARKLETARALLRNPGAVLEGLFKR
jgi:hypothetical protein